MPYLIIFSLIFTPLYLCRFKLFGLPLNFLMLWVWAVWIIFFSSLAAKKQLSGFWQFLKSIEKKLLFLILLFFLSGLISLFAGGFDKPKLGQFIVLFFQPISLFFISQFIFRQKPIFKNHLLFAAYCLLAAAGLYAIFQYFTLIGLPPKYWGNVIEPKRALSFFAHPNFYALFIAPLLAFLIPDVAERAKNWKLEIACLPARQENWKFIIAWFFGAFGLLFSMSRSGWIGLFAALIIYAFVAADRKIKKLVLGAVMAIVMVIVFTPNLRWRFLLPFYGEKSAGSRAQLWQSGWLAIKKSPILGLGLTGYGQNYEQLQADASLSSHNFPHNIFLNLWVETGLIGLISLIGLIGLYIFRGFKNRQNFIKLGISLFFVALLVQGQVDNPYFKNDLAMVFWIILSLGI